MKPNRTKEDILLLSQLQQGDKKAFNTFSEGIIRYYALMPTVL
jgi:RNA polymerase sigma-70 factor (ECF subfamily)